MLEDWLPVYVSVLVPVFWLIHGSQRSAEPQLQWLFSVVSLVPEGFAGHTLILSESRVALSEASCFSCCASKLVTR